MLDPKRWSQLMNRMSLTCDHADYQTIATMLDEPGRAYHNTSHNAAIWTFLFRHDQR